MLKDVPGNFKKKLEMTKKTKMPTLSSTAGSDPEPLHGVSWVDGHKARSRSDKDRRYGQDLPEEVTQ